MQTVVEEFEKKLGRCGKRGRNSEGSRFVAGDGSSDSQEGGRGALEPVAMLILISLTYRLPPLHPSEETPSVCSSPVLTEESPDSSP